MVDVRAGERRSVLCASGFLFCVMWSHYGLRPVRDAMGIVGHVNALSGLFLLTLAGSLALVPVFAYLVSRWSRDRVLAVVYRGAAACLLVFAAVLPGDATVARTFFVWASVFGMFALSVFWATMADVFAREEATRLFGIASAGGTLGALMGSLVTAVVPGRFGVAPLCILSAILLEGAVQLGRRLPRNAPRAAPEGGVLRWALVLLRSPRLLGIVVYMLLFTFTSTSLYFTQARIVKASLAETAPRTALFARIDLAVNCLSVVLQLLATGPLLRRVGVGRALAILPLLTLGGFVLLGARPRLETLVAVQVLRRGVDYGIAKPSREVLFTDLPREEKYKAKSFIDVFVYRAGDAIGAAAEAGLAVLVPVCLAWAGLAWMLGRRSSTR